MTVTAHHYRTALRRHPAGVAVVTLASSTGPVGFTATSFSSLSLDPPLVSFNITHTSSSMTALRAAKSLLVHLLGEQQIGLAQRFSRTAEERFADRTLWTTLESGEPLLLGTPTWLRALPQQLIAAGDSTLVIAMLTDIHCEGGVATPPPLLYHDGTYRGATTITG